jgi:hypothetical protein
MGGSPSSRSVKNYSTSDAITRLRDLLAAKPHTKAEMMKETGMPRHTVNTAIKKMNKEVKRTGEIRSRSPEYELMQVLETSPGKADIEIEQPEESDVNSQPHETFPQEEQEQEAASLQP